MNLGIAMDDFSSVLNKARSKFPGFSKVFVEAEALARWPEAVGPIISKHSRALSVRRAVLWVEVDHPIWRSELHHRKNQILDILNGDQPGTIKDVFFVDPKGVGGELSRMT